MLTPILLTLEMNKNVARRMWDTLGGVAQMKPVVEIQQKQVSFLRAPSNLRDTEGWMLS